jgi:PIN domain nuclease of toxin-antitoxin system
MAGNSAVFVLDSFAILAYFHAENGGERVLELLMTPAKIRLDLR